MASLSDVRTRIKNALVITTTEYDTQIDDAIRSAIKLYTGRPFWFLEANTTITVAAGNSSVALPADFASPIFFRLSNGTIWLSQGKGFDVVSYEDLRKHFAMVGLTTGTPTACAIFGDTLYINTVADTDYDIDVDYIKKDENLPMGDGETSVWLGDEGEGAIRTLAMAMFKDEDMQFEVSEKDWARATKYYNDLLTQNTFRAGSI